LLIGGFVLLVYDDQSQPLKREKYRGAYA
jgi:hypothetical protein